MKDTDMRTVELLNQIVQRLKQIGSPEALAMIPEALGFIDVWINPETPTNPPCLN